MTLNLTKGGAVGSCSWWATWERRLSAPSACCGPEAGRKILQELRRVIPYPADADWFAWQQMR